MPELDSYCLFYATHADLLRRVGNDESATQSYLRVLELVANDSERHFLER
jgi:RNA polymerase sigma-70 factor (ECF subfamily)